MKNLICCGKPVSVLLILFFVLVLSQFAYGAQIKLAWDPNTESDLAGYKVYYGTSSRSYTNSVDVGNVTTHTLAGLTEGVTYYFSITAYNSSSSESGYSGEVSGVAVEAALPVSEPPPTVSTTPSSEPTTTSEPATTDPGSSSSGDTTSTDTGGCSRDANAAVRESPEAKYVGTHLYIALAEMSASGPSMGNIKKYEVSATEVSGNSSNSTNSSNSSNSSIQVGDILDADKTPALDTDDLINGSSRSHWSREADGRQVDKGGVGEILLTRSKRRNLFTNLGDSDLTSESNAFSTSNGELTPELLGLGPKDKLERDRVIQYVHGYDSYAKAKEGTPLKKRRWILGSIVHSRPLVIHYEDKRAVIFVGANDGMLHAFEDGSGEELWGFIPSEFLSRLKEMPRESGFQYYVDGSPKAYITESRKIVIFGLRRGGRHYYALDVTDPERPRFLWKIGPETPGYSELGQSWSTPHVGKVRFGTSERGVCFVGGGYDENQDRNTVSAEDKRGRAVYVVDVQSGEQLWRWDYHRDSNMSYSIPSDISRVDTDGDGYTDRLYVGDMGGRLWRFDLGGSDTSGWSGRVFFSGRGKIFYAPDVTLEKGYEMVFFGTGDREHPNESSVVNRFYAVKDKGASKVLTEGDLEDVTGGFSSNTVENKQGWYISLGVHRGEKVTGVPVVASGAVYFTTFSPSSSGGGEKVARVYALNYRNGNGILNFDTGNDTEGVRIGLSDRWRVIGSGVPSGTVMTALKGRLVAYTGFNGGIYRTPLRRYSTTIPVWWKQVF